MDRNGLDGVVQIALPHRFPKIYLSNPCFYPQKGKAITLVLSTWHQLTCVLSNLLAGPGHLLITTKTKYCVNYVN